MKGEKTETMATFTQTSIGPSSDSVLSAASSTAAASATSLGSTSARRPYDSTSRLAPSRPSCPRAISATLAPFFANRRTAARPAPADAPVTTTTLGNAMNAPGKDLAGRPVCLEGGHEETRCNHGLQIGTRFIAAPTAER